MKTLLLLLAVGACALNNPCINVTRMEKYGFHFDSHGRLNYLAQLGQDDFDVNFSKKEKQGGYFLLKEGQH